MNVIDLPTLDAEVLQYNASLKPAEPQQVVLPTWLANPTCIPASLSDPEYQLSIDEKQLGLSERVQQILTSQLEITRLFPVQVAILKALTKHSENPQEENQKGHEDERGIKSWQTCFLDASRHIGDVYVSAPTGSGKTLAYVLPLVEMLYHRQIPCTRALIVVPTRDLVKQVVDTFRPFLADTSLRILGMSGGGNKTDALKVDGREIKKTLEKERVLLTGARPVDIVVTTPGRLVEHLKYTPDWSLTHVRWLVVDEVDRLLKASYDQWLALILERLSHSACPEKATLFSVRTESGLSCNASAATGTVQTVHADGCWSPNGVATSLQKILLSATLTRHPGKLAALQLKQPRCFLASTASSSSQANPPTDAQTQVSVAEERFVLPTTLHQSFVICPRQELKPLYVLLAIYRQLQTSPSKPFPSTLCFTNSTEDAHRLMHLLKSFLQRYPLSCDLNIGIYASTLSLAARTSTLRQFRAGSLHFLVCTDALARGLDLPDVYFIVNYDLPFNFKTYIHRVGRTARAGRQGQALTLVEANECRYWKQVTRKYGLYSHMHRWTKSEVKKQRYGCTEDKSSSLEQVQERYQLVLADLTANPQ